MSPCHALLIDGVLVPAGILINGVSITRHERAPTVSYIHLELANHDAIWAEGVPAETFVDDDSRGIFHNAHEYVARFPDEKRCPALYCAPRLQDGFEVEAIRRRIAHRAGLGRLSAPPAFAGPDSRRSSRR